VTVIEELREQRFQERLGKAKTPRQIEVMQKLHDDGKSVYAATRTGKGVVAEFKRYVTTCDPQKIGNGLYHWSIYDGPGDIAHFNLYGFRSVYLHPALYLELLLFPWLDRDPRIPNPYVYTDALTSYDLRDQIKEIAVQYRARVNRQFAETKKQRELAEANELAARYGMTLVPKEDA